MGLRSKLKTLLDQEIIDDLQQKVKDVVEDGLDRHIRLAVTGLSRSGKTVFITSLAHHLLESHDSKALPFFELVGNGRVISVKDLSSESGNPFPLAEAIDNLSSEPPIWPQSTQGLSEVRLAIRYQPASRLERFVKDTATLYLDIVDYPGEWLLDLPLLKMSYAEWCQQQQVLLQQEPRATVCKDWLERLSNTDWSQPIAPEQVNALYQEYAALLSKLRQDNAMSLLQPGRAILPGDLKGSSLLTLFPIPFQDGYSDSAPDSGYHFMQSQYEAYCEQVVKRFYREHFSRFDRQIVLVDCLKTLNQGKACFDDMKLAINEILQSFNYGSSGFLRRIFSPRIDRVLFASSKADHVTANQHHNLDKFLELIIQESQREMRFDGIETTCMALASIRSTEAAQAQLDGQTLSCLKGYNKLTGKEVAIFPGEVPIELPEDKDWNQERFRFVDFAPKKLPKSDLRPEHHIRLDQALEFLLGDKL